MANMNKILLLTLALTGSALAQVNVGNLPSLTGATMAENDQIMIRDVSVPGLRKITGAEFRLWLGVSDMSGKANLTGGNSWTGPQVHGGNMTVNADLAVAGGGLFGSVTTGGNVTGVTGIFSSALTIAGNVQQNVSTTVSPTFAGLVLDGLGASNTLTFSGGSNSVSNITAERRLDLAAGVGWQIVAVSEFQSTDATQSTSTTTGAMRTAGGLGVFKNANIGGTLTVTGASTLGTVSGTGITGTSFLQSSDYVALSRLLFTGNAQINSPSAENIQLRNNAGTSFGLLQLGGTTNLFPAIKRSGPSVGFRRADDTIGTFANLPAASSANEGSVYPVSDSTTVIWGATVTGGGSNHVLAYSNGTNWTVMAK